MKTCAFCKEAMQDAALACPHCGKPAGATLVGAQIIAGIFLVLVVVVVVYVVVAVYW